MALSKDTPRAFELGSINALPVKASTKVYEGAAVGIDAASGYARGLNAGDPFAGFAESQADNSGGSNGDVRVRVRTAGEVELSVGSLAITDIGKAVYASDDGTFTLTQGSNSYVGKVVRFVSTGIGVVSFDVVSGGGTLAELTDNSTGSASDTIAAITDAATKNAIASLAAKVNALIRMNK